MTEVQAPASPPRVVRIWSPLAVSVYSLILGYPAGILLAVRNWGELGTRKRIRPHVIGAFALTVVFIGFMLLVNYRIGRGVAIALSLAAFSYLKELLKSDVADFRSAHPDATIAFRPWYTALGWALLALLMFFSFAFIIIGMTMEIVVPE